MLHLSRWSMAFIIAVILAAIVFVIPNFFSKETVASWPGWLPKQQVVLGLDLQGGSSLLYQLDEQGFIADQLSTLAGEVRSTLRQDPAVSYSGLSTGDQIAANCAAARLRQLLCAGADRRSGAASGSARPAQHAAQPAQQRCRSSQYL